MHQCYIDIVESGHEMMWTVCTTACVNMYELVCLCVYVHVCMYIRIYITT